MDCRWTQSAFDIDGCILLNAFFSAAREHGNRVWVVVDPEIGTAGVGIAVEVGVGVGVAITDEEGALTVENLHEGDARAMRKSMTMLRRLSWKNKRRLTSRKRSKHVLKTQSR